MFLSREKRIRIELYEDYFVSSSRDENGEWKVRDGYTTEYVDSFFQAYWTRGLDISSDEVISRIIESLGWSPENFLDFVY